METEDLEPGSLSDISLSEVREGVLLLGAKTATVGLSAARVKAAMDLIGVEEATGGRDPGRLLELFMAGALGCLSLAAKAEAAAALFSLVLATHGLP